MKYLPHGDMLPKELSNYYTKNVSVKILSFGFTEWMFSKNYWVDVGIQKSTFIFKHFMLL